MFQKVLVIDEQPACAELAEKILAQQYPGAPVDVLYAESGMDAFDRLQVALPELIILSDSLPDIHTEAILQRLAGDPLTAQIPVCLANASGEADALEDRYANLRKVVVSPMGRDAISELLAKVVSARRAVTRRVLRKILPAWPLAGTQVFFICKPPCKWPTATDLPEFYVYS